MILFFEQFKKCREKTQKLEPKSCKFFGLDFFWGWKKNQKVAKMQPCNFATLQLFGLIAFYYCFLIKKGKKQQKLQSCKVAFLQLFVFFSKNFWPKKFWIFVGFFFESQKFGFQKPYPYFFGAWIPTVFMSETLSLFFGVGIDLNSFYFINPIPIFWGVWISTVFISETLSLFFLGGLDLNSFFSETLSLSFVWGGWISTVFISETLSLFFCQVFISTVFISETFFLFSKIKTVEMKTLQKNREKVSEIKTVEMKTLQKIGRRFLKWKLLRWKPCRKKIGRRFLKWKLLRSLFFGGGMDLTVFISETFSLRKPYHPLISQVSISKIYPLEGPIINGNLWD